MSKKPRLSKLILSKLCGKLLFLPKKINLLLTEPCQHPIKKNATDKIKNMYSKTGTLAWIIRNFQNSFLSNFPWTPIFRITAM